MYDDFIMRLRGALDIPLFTLGESQVTILSVIVLILLFVGVILAERILRRFLFVRLLRRTKMDTDLQDIIAKVAGVILILVGLYISIQVVAIDLGPILNYTLVTLGDTQLTPASLLVLLLLFALVIIGENLTRRFFLMRMLRQTYFEPALQYAIARIVGYTLLALGFYISLHVVGIDLSSLAILAGAIGVGLGFGLQNVVNNFVSGLIILAERPIAIGDRVEVGDVAGQVERIGLRSTTVLTNDNISIIVPNGNFISESVINWSHGDRKVRFRIPVGVAYGSDVEKLKKVLLEVAADHPDALKNPEPTVYFNGFGDSSLNFELAVWSEEMTFKPRRFRSDLYFAIERKLRENKIEIPFPQRDLHLRSGKFILEQKESKESG